MIGSMQVLSTDRFTVEEYHRLGEVGILGEDDRVELLDATFCGEAQSGQRSQARSQSTSSIQYRLEAHATVNARTPNPKR
jgi:hypothetical protein